jgi:hypothetical protein
MRGAHYSAALLNDLPWRQGAGWRRLLFLGVCDFPKGLVGADGIIKAVTSDE